MKVVWSTDDGSSARTKQVPMGWGSSRADIDMGDRKKCGAVGAIRGINCKGTDSRKVVVEPDRIGLTQGTSGSS